MEKQSFIALVKRYYPWICSMEKAAFRIHDDVNQKYDHVLGSPDKPGGLSIQLCKSEKKEFYIRYSS